MGLGQEMNDEILYKPFHAMSYSDWSSTNLDENIEVNRFSL
jgi:hypothetical protein